jgi:hypothetical protein
VIELRLRQKTLRDGRVVLDLGPAFRVVFGFLAVILALGVAGSDSAGALPIVALIVLVLGSLYQEQWEFDPKRQLVISRHGLIGLSRTRRRSFDEIERVEYTHYRAGSVPGSEQPPPPGANEASDDAWAITGMGRLGHGLRRHFLRYALVTTDGVRIRVEMRRVRDWEKDVQLPRTLAAVLGVPLDETPV